MKSMKEERKHGNQKNKFLFLVSVLSSFLSPFMLFMLFMVKSDSSPSPSLFPAEILTSR